MRRAFAPMFVAIFAAWTLSSYTTPGPVRYIDVTEKSGVRFQVDSSPTTQKYLPESMVGGVAVLDYDGDGRMDLYFVNGAALSDPMPPGARPDKSDTRY